MGDYVSEINNPQHDNLKSLILQLAKLARIDFDLKHYGDLPERVSELIAQYTE